MPLTGFPGGNVSHHILFHKSGICGNCRALIENTPSESQFALREEQYGTGAAPGLRVRRQPPLKWLVMNEVGLGSPKDREYQEHGRFSSGRRSLKKYKSQLVTL